MIKKRFAGFMIALFIMSLPAIVNAAFENEIKLLASDGAASDFFGMSVSISGDTVIVGAYADDDNGSASGSAYVLVRNAGVWTEQQKLTASDGAADDRFGWSVSISGDTAIVGVERDDDNGSNSGSAYVFVRNAGVWTEQQKLTASDGAGGDYFGSSVSISGDTAIVGAYLDDDIGTSSGSAYVFVRDADGVWTEQQKLTASDGAASDWFGYSVSISGDTAIVGAYGDDDSGTYSGSAYVFVRDADGNWTEQQNLIASDGAASDWFGYSVSISGDTAIVGAYGNGSYSGSAYVFVRNAGVWTEQQKLTASDGAAFDGFGKSVSISGDTAIVGAYGDDDNGANSGSAYVFVRNAGVWTEQQKLTASDGAGGDYFGLSVSISGDTAIVGASHDDDSGTYSGSAYVYQGTAASAPEINVTDSVAPAGDLSVPFGDVTVSTESLQTVTITNNGNADLILGDIGVEDPLADPFNWMDDCFGQTLAPGASCTFDVYFLPTTTGPFNDTFDIPSNDPDEDPVMVNVSGTGTSTTVPDITVSSISINFGNVTENTSQTQTVTVTNDGNADLILGNIAAADPLAAPFSALNDNCSGQTLAPAANCTFVVEFAPTTTGPFNDSLDIPSDDPDENPVTVNVSGTGTATPVPDITVSTTSINFGNLTEGLTSDQTVTVTNDGNADLVLGDIAAADPLAAPFSALNDNCSGQTLASAANCTFVVEFAPITTGPFNDSLDIPSDDPDENPVTVNVSGTGLQSITNNPPDQPKLVSPANGQENLPTTVTLKWDPVTDPDGDPVTYDIYYCQDYDPYNNCTSITVSSLEEKKDKPLYAGFGYGGGMILFGIVFAAGFRDRKRIGLMAVMLIFACALLVSCGSRSHDSNYKTYTISGLNSGATYYWGIAAKDDKGGESQSDVWRFTTE